MSWWISSRPNYTSAYRKNGQKRKVNHFMYNRIHSNKYTNLSTFTICNNGSQEGSKETRKDSNLTYGRKWIHLNTNRIYHNCQLLFSCWSPSFPRRRRVLNYSYTLPPSASFCIALGWPSATWFWYEQLAERLIYLSSARMPRRVVCLHHNAAPPGTGAITDDVTGIATELVQRPTGRPVASGCHHQRSIAGGAAQRGNSRLIAAAAGVSVAMRVRMMMIRCRSRDQRQLERLPVGAGRQAAQALGAQQRPVVRADAGSVLRTVLLQVG